MYITVCNHVISALLGLSIMKVYNTHVLATFRVNTVVGERQQQQQASYQWEMPGLQIRAYLAYLLQANG